VFQDDLRMHCFVRAFALTAVALHAIGGCCWHHTHAEHPGSCDPSGAAVAWGLADESEHRYETGHRHPRQQDHGCEGGCCDFVVPRVGQPDESSAGARPFVPAVAAGLSSHTSAHLPLDRGLAGRPGPAVRLRLHLLEQVLLL
jgi:hypothetical protein